MRSSATCATRYIAQPHTIYREARKLAPGHILTLREGVAADAEMLLGSARHRGAGQRRNDPAPDADEAIERLDALLRDAVKLRMIADVPLGAFLSGGIDSSTVVALMQAQSTRPVQDVLHRLPRERLRRGAHAPSRSPRISAPITPSSTSSRATRSRSFRDLPEWFDEPFADSSQIPTYLVSELARKHVTVALSGDGGDELFAGYNRYLWAERLCTRGEPACRARCAAPRPRRCARWRRKPGAGCSRLVPAAWRPRAARRQAAQDRDAARQSRAGRDLPTAGQPMGARPTRLPRRGRSRTGRCGTRPSRRTFPDFVPRMQFLDMVTYLPDDILTKVDRATMAVGLEGRVPLLDHRVVEFAWSLPLAIEDPRRQAASGSCAACSIATCRGR